MTNNLVELDDDNPDRNAEGAADQRQRRVEQPGVGSNNHQGASLTVDSSREERGDMIQNADINRRIQEDRLVMMKDIYFTKKQSLLTSLQNLESRVQSLNKDSPLTIVEKSMQKMEELEGKLVDLWEARMGYMALLTSPQEAANEMALGRRT